MSIDIDVSPIGAMPFICAADISANNSCIQSPFRLGSIVHKFGALERASSRGSYGKSSRILVDLHAPELGLPPRPPIHKETPRWAESKPFFPVSEGNSKVYACIETSEDQSDGNTTKQEEAPPVRPLDRLVSSINELKHYNLNTILDMGEEAGFRREKKKWRRQAARCCFWG